MELATRHYQGVTLCTRLKIADAIIFLELFVCVLGELGVENNVAWRKVNILDILATLGGPEFTIHRAIFPLNTQWPHIFNIIEGTDN